MKGYVAHDHERSPCDRDASKDRRWELTLGVSLLS